MKQNGEDKLADMLMEAEARLDSEPNEPCASVRVDRDGHGIEVILDTSRRYYGEWINGEGADIAIYRDCETKKVVGCYLPCYMDRVVFDDPKDAG